MVEGNENRLGSWEELLIGHKLHLVLAEQAYSQFSLDEVWDDAEWQSAA